MNILQALATLQGVVFPGSGGLAAGALGALFQLTEVRIITCRALSAPPPVLAAWRPACPAGPAWWLCKSAPWPP